MVVVCSGLDFSGHAAISILKSEWWGKERQEEGLGREDGPLKNMFDAGDFNSTNLKSSTD